MEPPKKIRLEKELYSQPGRIYFVTVNTNFKKGFFIEDNFNREIIQCLLTERNNRYSIFVYCLMPDHIHFLISTNAENYSITDFVNRFKGLTTRIGWKYGVEKVLWQRRFYDHILRKQEDAKKIAEYIVSNPVRKGLVKNWKEYPYCGYIDEF
ncbi:MAG: hypothetical protein CVU77_01350 [Elusimicrobia bacterium HGW-Elusimicrobia-1]|jgi:REP element-mobilizing transposase RayT|nr:MAG: hypothetical protein CVU77_01350 [Elusimicrobia bacterium HGW-Elusimicrobia-1]